MIKRLIFGLTAFSFMIGIAFSCHAQGIGLSERFKYRSRIWTSLDGTDDYMTVSSPSYATQAKAGGKAVAFWFELNSTLVGAGARNLLGMGNTTGGATGGFLAFQIRRHASYAGLRTSITSRIEGGTVSGNYGSNILVPGVKYFFVGQTNGTVYQSYLGSSGVLRAETIGQWVNSNTGNWYNNLSISGTRITGFGAGFSGLAPPPANFLDGKLDELVIFNDDLTLAEATALYNGGVPIDPRMVGLASKVVSYYKMGEGGENDSITTIYDRVGSDNLTSSGMANSALEPVQYPQRSASSYRTDFDGVNERAFKAGPSGFMTDATGSLSFWFVADTVLTSDNTSRQVLGGVGDNRTGTTFAQLNVLMRRLNSAYGDNDSHLTIFLRNGDSSLATSTTDRGASTPIVAGTLYHVVITADGAAWKIYINGVDQTLVTGSGTGTNTGKWFAALTQLTGASKYFAVGETFRNNAWTGNPHDGVLDEIIITSQVLNQAQVTALYNNGIPLDPAAVIDSTLFRSYWRMGDGGEKGSVTTFYDQMGTNDLTSENMENADIQAVTY